jgi:hypothetical protein
LLHLEISLIDDLPSHDDFLKEEVARCQRGSQLVRGLDKDIDRKGTGP